jgi:phospholipase/carboxylesterase
MPRFFRRMRGGAFDEDDLIARAAELAAFVAAASKEYGFEAGGLTAIGFSNGANVASALMLLHPEAISAAILVSAMPPFRRPPGVILTGHRLLISNGLRDPLAPPSLTQRLVENFTSRGARVDVLQHPGGHQLAAAHLPVMREFVNGSDPRVTP